MSLGQEVEYKKGDCTYLGIVVGIYDDGSYLVSVQALGIVVKIDAN